jgi:hypothetical protein
MLRKRKRNLLKDDAGHLGVTHQSGHDGSDSLLGQPARQTATTHKGRVKAFPPDAAVRKLCGRTVQTRLNNDGNSIEAPPTRQ